MKEAEGELGRWLSGKEPLLPRHEDLSSNPWNPHEKPDMSCIPATPVLGNGSRRIAGLLAASLILGSVTDAISRE